MGEIRILLADDQHVVRAGLRLILEQADDLTVVAEAADGEEAVRLYAGHHPDVALLDMRMPRLDGPATTAQILRQDANARVVLLSTYQGDEDIRKGLHAGAKAYLLKDTTPDALLATVRDVHAGKTVLPPEVAGKVVGRMREESLTAREIEVLTLMADGLSNKQIGSRLHIAEGTVKLHVNNLYAKLGVNGRVEAVVVALKRGLVHIQ